MAGGVAAMSQDSCKLLTEREQLSIGRVVAADANAAMLSYILKQ